MKIEHPIVIYLPDSRDVTLSRYGHGNTKLGSSVFTYSRLPGRPNKAALGTVDSSPTHNPHPMALHTRDDYDEGLHSGWHGTCPGSTPECERLCYCSRPVSEIGPVASMWLGNSMRDDVPKLPDDAKLLRLHVSGDFDSNRYIRNWTFELDSRSDVTCWVYTRSWRVPELLDSLEELRALHNVQMFASMDKSTVEMPPDGWRRAWIDGDPRAGEIISAKSHSELAGVIKGFNLQRTEDAVKSLICPEETGAVKNCEECGFCFLGKRNDVTFLEH